MSDDTLYRLMIPSLHLRAYAVITTDTAREIVSAHSMTPNAASAVGKAISAAALLSSNLQIESDQNLTFRVQGNGPLREIMVQTDARGNMRAYTARPHVDEEVDLGSISFSKAIGIGVLTVTKDLGLKEPYTGTVHLASGELALDTAYYLTASEQVPSAVVLSVPFSSDGTIAAAGGILIQSFPDTPADSIALVESALAKKDAPLGTALEKNEDIVLWLRKKLGDVEVEITAKTGIRHRCRCTHDLVLSLLGTFESDEIKDMINKDGSAEIHCTFCNKKYTFSKEDLEEVLKKTIQSDIKDSN